MAKRIFLAGATGVVGQRLVPLLAQVGYSSSVYGRPSTFSKAERIS